MKLVASLLSFSAVSGALALPDGKARLGCLWLPLKHIFKLVASLLSFSAVKLDLDEMNLDISQFAEGALLEEVLASDSPISPIHEGANEKPSWRDSARAPVALKEVQRLRPHTCSNELEARGTRRWRSHQLHRTVTSPLGGTKVLQDDDVNDTTKMLLGSLGLLGTVITEYLIVVGAPIRTRTWRLRGGGSW